MKRLQDIRVNTRDVIESALDGKAVSSLLNTYFARKITEKEFIEDLNQILVGVETDIKMRIRDTANMDDDFGGSAA